MLLVALAALLNATGCAYRHPHLAPAINDANAPAATIHVGDAIHTLHVLVEYETATPDSAPAIIGARVIVEPPPSGAEVPWSMAWQIDGDDATTTALAMLPLKKSERQRRAAWRLPAQAVDAPTATLLAIAPSPRSGASPVVLRLSKRAVEPADVAHVALPVLVQRRRSLLVLCTYPLWGLVRDALDAPITAANQGGLLFRPTLATILGKAPRRNTAGVAFVAGTIAVGTVAFYAFVAPSYFAAGLDTSGLGALHPVITGVRWVASLPLVMAVSGAAGLALLGANEFVLGPAQTYLLRSGSGASAWRNVAPIDLARGWDDAALARYATWRRTFDYFPNWRTIAHDAEWSAPAPPPPLWTIDAVEPADP